MLIFESRKTFRLSWSRVYNRFGLQKHLYRSRHPGTSVPFSVFDFF